MSCNAFRFVSRFVTALNNTVDRILSVANGILCIPSVLANADQVLKGIGNALGNAIAETISDISNLVVSYVQNIANNILGVINDAIRAVFGGLADLFNCFSQTVTGLQKAATSIVKRHKSVDDCTVAAAMLANCIFGEVRKKITNDVAVGLQSNRVNINSVTNEILTDLSKPKSVFTDYVNKQEKYFNRATNQLNNIL